MRAGAVENVASDIFAVPRGVTTSSTGCPCTTILLSTELLAVYSCYAFN